MLSNRRNAHFFNRQCIKWSVALLTSLSTAGSLRKGNPFLTSHSRSLFWGERDPWDPRLVWSVGHWTWSQTIKDRGDGEHKEKTRINAIRMQLSIQILWKSSDENSLTGRRKNTQRWKKGILGKLVPEKEKLDSRSMGPIMHSSDQQAITSIEDPD